MKKTLLTISFLALLLIGASFFIFSKREDTQIACTMEAKLCPDGSYVGRSGPRCEFAPCPTVTSTTSAKINQKILNNGIYITPLDILEDSRCPAHVNCIWAGQVRIDVLLQSDKSTKEVSITLGKSIFFDGKNVELSNVAPKKESTKVISDSEYTFDFTVK